MNDNIPADGLGMAKVIVIPLCTPEVESAKSAATINDRLKSLSLSLTSPGRSHLQWDPDKPECEVRTPAGWETLSRADGRSMREVDATPVTEDALVAKYRQMFAGPTASSSGSQQPSRRNTWSTAPPTRFPSKVADSPSAAVLTTSQRRSTAVAVGTRAAEINRNFVTAARPSSAAFGSGATGLRLRRASSASWSNRKLQLRDPDGRRSETANGYRPRQPSAGCSTSGQCGTQDRRASSVATSRQMWKVACAISDAGPTKSRCIAGEQDPGCAIEGRWSVEDDVDSGFNRDESSTRDSSTVASLLQGDETAVGKGDERLPQQQIEDNPHPVREVSERTESVAGLDHSLPAVILTERDRPLPVAPPTDYANDHVPPNETATIISGRSATEKKLYKSTKQATATKTSAAQVSLFMSPEARQALSETWRDKERLRDIPPPDTTSNADADAGQTSGAGRRVTVRVAPCHDSPVVTNVVQRSGQQTLTLASRQNVKQGLISASMTSTASSPVSRRCQASEATHRRATSSLPRRTQRYVIDEMTSCVPPHHPSPANVAPSTGGSISAAHRSSLADSCRPRTASGTMSSFAASRHKHRPRSPFDKPAEDGESSSGNISDFRITSSTYDSRYADMMAAAALDEMWRQRGAAVGDGRWNEKNDQAVNGTVDRLIRELAVAKCMAWLTKQDQPLPPRRRSSIYE